MGQAGAGAGQAAGDMTARTARPQYHFTAPRNWINDPNGLIYIDGRYHLFYQHNPYSCDWGHVHWGHAVSDNLIDWQHLPLAIPDTPEFCSFSGSAVIDRDNVSGLGRNGQPALLAFYTAAQKADTTLQQQHLAYSHDGGLTWQDYPGNPLIACTEPDVRDPKVFWSAAAGKWVMLLAIAWKHQVGIYHSDNLIDWQQVSAFETGEDYAGEWECPDLVELTDPVSGLRKWCMIVSIGEGAPCGDSGIQYFLGTFDGTHFVPDAPGGRWVDAGPDFYASQTWAELPAAQDRTVWTAWMNNRAYAARTPAEVWRGCHVVPRTMALHSGPDDILRLTQHPVAELDARSEVIDRMPAITTGPDGGTVFARALAGRYLDLSLAGLAADEACLHLTVEQDGQRLCQIDIDGRAGALRYIRDWAQFAEPAHDPVARSVPFQFAGEFRDLRLIIDDSTLELFSGTGTTVLSLLLFPGPGPIHARIDADGPVAIAELALRALQVGAAAESGLSIMAAR